jgi:hypothetical protein
MMKNVCIIGADNLANEIIDYIYDEFDSIYIKKIKGCDNERAKIKILTNISEMKDCYIILVVNQSDKDEEMYYQYTGQIAKHFICVNSRRCKDNILVDCCPCYKINKETDKDYNSICISNITEDGYVYCINKHEYKPNDIVKFYNLQGYNMDQFNKNFIIESVTDISFKIIGELEPFKFINASCIYIHKQIEIYNDPFKFMESKMICEPTKLDESFIAIKTSFEITKLLYNIYYPTVNLAITLCNNKTNLQQSSRILVIGYNYYLLKMLSLLNITIIYKEIIEENTIGNNINIDVIINASNNTNIQDLLSVYSINNNIPLFAYETLGNNGMTCISIPYLTDTSNIKFELCSKKTEYPMCIIKNYPNCYDHLLIWSNEEYEILNNMETKFETLNNCFEYAIALFNKYFMIEINKLIDVHSNKDNEFWSKGKRCPRPIELDLDNKLHHDYIYSTINILCIKNNIKHDLDFYDPEKWIYLSIELRRQNYDIEFVESSKVCYSEIHNKLSENITINLLLTELVKYLDYPNAKMQTYNINLANNTFVTNPINLAKIIEINNQKFNEWDKFTHNTDCILNDFIKKYNKLFNVNISIISNECSIIYASFLEENLDTILSDIFCGVDVILTLCCEEDIDLPNINIKLE